MRQDRYNENRVRVSDEPELQMLSDIFMDIDHDEL